MVDLTLETLGKLLTIYGFAMAAGAGATLGMLVVCRWLKWAPVNVTVHVKTETGSVVVSRAPGGEG